MTQMRNELSIVISSETMVSPQPCQGKEDTSLAVTLCNLDYFSPIVEGARFDFILLFSHQDNENTLKVVEAIRKSLPGVLAQYPALGGRLKRPSPTFNGKIQAHFTGEGVILVEATCTVSLAILNNLDDIYIPEARKLLLFPPPDLPLEQLPPLILQLTMFSCGGFALGANFNHNICDGSGAAMFMRDLARQAKGLPYTEASPTFNREMFAAQHPPRVQFDHLPFQPSRNLQPTETRPEWGEIESFFVLVPFDQVKSIQAKLRKHDNLESTSFEVLAAVAWRARIKTLGVQSTNEVRLLFTVNVGNVLGMGRNEFGNKVIYTCACESAKDVLEQGLAYVVNAIRKSKECLSEEYVRSVIDYIEEKNQSFNGDLSPFNSFNSWDDMDFSSWRWLGFDTVDFGMGEPSVVCPGNFMKSQNTNLLMSDAKEVQCHRAYFNLPSNLIASFKSHFSSGLN